MSDEAGTSEPRPVRGITVPYRLRFDECGPDGVGRTSALLRYAQDIAWIHSERLGFGREWYAERGLAWVVRAAELAVLAPIPLGTTLDLSTAVTGLRRVWARRRTDARLADGTLAMWGHTDWVMTDARGLPGRVPSEFLDAFDVPPGSFDPGRVSLPPTPSDASVQRALVRPQDLDPMGHVNNAAYLDYLEEALLAVDEPGVDERGADEPAGGPPAAALTSILPRCVRLEYLAPASPGTSVSGSTWPLATADGHGPGRAWRLTDEDGRELARGTVTLDAGSAAGA